MEPDVNAWKDWPALSVSREMYFALQTIDRANIPMLGEVRDVRAISGYDADGRELSHRRGAVRILPIQSAEDRLGFAFAGADRGAEPSAHQIGDPVHLGPHPDPKARALGRWT
jgi:hypothetical protein